MRFCSLGPVNPLLSAVPDDSPISRFSLFRELIVYLPSQETLSLGIEKMYKREITCPLNLVRGEEKVKAAMAWMALSLYSVVEAKIEEVLNEVETKVWREV